MRRILVLVCAVTVLAGAEPVHAAKACPDTVAISGKRWQYQGTGLGCKFMKKWTRSYVRDGMKPAGFRCTKNEVNGLCRKGERKVFVFQVVRR